MNKTFGSFPQPYWDWRAAGNFMFGGTGGALMLALALASYPGSPPMLPGLAALAFVGLGLLLVWLEIGRPWRFLNVFFHPQTSWMTREGSVAVVLFITTLAAVLFADTRIMLGAGFLGLTFLYCQARILTASTGIPAWRERALLPLIILTGLAEGCALLVLIQQVFGYSPTQAVLPVLAALLLLRSAAWTYYRSALGKARAAASVLPLLDRLRIPWLIGGNLLPMLFIVYAWYSGALWALLLAAALATVFGWHLKFVIVVRAAVVQGYGIGTLKHGRPTPRMPVRRKS